MARDLSSSNNDLLKKIGSSILNESEMNKLYSKNISEQQKKLKQIFTVISDNDVTATEKKALQTGAEKLKAKIETLEAKMAALSDEISKK